MSIRKKNFEENEILRLLALYKENAEVLNSKFSNVSTSKSKKQKWEAIQCAVNAIGKQQRTIDELKHKWKDLLSRAKKDYSNRRYPQTGGGPKPPEGPYTHLVLDIIGQSSPVLDGITTCGESTVEGMEEAYEVSEQNIPPAKPSTSCESASDEKDTSVAPKATPLSSSGSKRIRLSVNELTREQLHHQLLTCEIKKVNLEIEKLELEKTKLEKEITKLDLEIWFQQQQQQLQIQLHQQQMQMQQFQQLQVLQQPQQSGADAGQNGGLTNLLDSA